MQAVVIANERETRMGPLTDNRSLYSLPLGGSTVIEHVIDTLKEVGVDEIALNIDNKGLKGLFGVERGVDRVEQDDVSIRFVNQREKLTAGLDQEEGFLCVRADMLYDTDDLKRLSQVDKGFGYVDYLDEDAQGRVTVKKSEVDDIQPGELKNTGKAGVYAFKFPREAHEWDYGIDPMAVEFAHTHKPTAVEMSSWQQLIRPHDLLRANLEAEPFIHDSAEVRGTVRDNCVIGRNVTVEEGAVVDSSVVMEDTRIGANSFVGHTVVGEEADVGEGVTVASRNTDDRPSMYNLDGRRVEAGTNRFGAIIGARTDVLAGATLTSGLLLDAGLTVAAGETR